VNRGSDSVESPIGTAHHSPEIYSRELRINDMDEKSLAVFENYKIRRHYDEEAETL
jgi:hypothetical protein